MTVLRKRLGKGGYRGLRSQMTFRPIFLEVASLNKSWYGEYYKVPGPLLLPRGFSLASDHIISLLL